LANSAEGFQVMLGNGGDFLATRISYKLDLKGPSVNVQTACSTSLVAVQMACKELFSGECDMALAGGVSLCAQQIGGYFYQPEGILSPDGHCRAFDKRAQGTVGTGGVGMVVLKRLSDALADGDTIRAVIKGAASNNDGALKVGFTAPSVQGQAGVIATAQAMAGVEARSIDYIEAHGTGTALGDPIEIAALTQAFRLSTRESGFCAIGSVKTNIGHADAAAGVAGLIKTVLALEHGQIPPSLHFEAPNPKIDFLNSPFYVNTRLQKWGRNGMPRRAGVSSFGIGGTNAHVILEEAPERMQGDKGWPYQILVVSARTSSALDQATANLLAYLKENEQADLADVAYTLQVGRKAWGKRRVVIGVDRAQAIRALETKEGVFTAAGEIKERPVVFMFSGQGAQYVGMGRELYKQAGVFRTEVDRCSELLKAEMGVDIREVLYAESAGAAEMERLQSTQYAQPALFVVEYALAKLWMSWGVEPQAMIGHSIGEYVAACLAGVFSLEEGLKLVAARGRLMQQLPGGSMLSVPFSGEGAQALLLEFGLEHQLCVAAENGPELSVVSGANEWIDKLEAVLVGRGVGTRRLHTSHAFHSAMMDAIVEPFVRFVRRVKLRPPARPYLSNLTGKLITPEEATDSAYWGRHLRGTVRFCAGVQELMTTAGTVFLEVGPGRSLVSLVKAQASEAAVSAVASLPPPQAAGSDVVQVLQALGQLWLAGGKVDWAGLHAGRRRCRVPLPTYPFERQRYWIDKRPENRPASSNPAGKKADISDWF
ncbi:MAG TPA: type I polyketide synthase, partial [Lacunisphaera sp.]|nr:type I polyketide synthase [Lacunisphaera sp.]